MKRTSLLLRTLLLTATVTASLKADILLDTGAIAFDGTGPTFTSRPFRDSTPSDWSTAKAFPGLAGAVGPFFYTTITIPLATGAPVYVQVSTDDPFGTVFVSAYHTSFTPGPGFPTGANYLGDAGLSGNPFGNPGFFQVIVPADAPLVLLLTRPTPGVGSPFAVLVEGFADSNFAPLPEPMAYGLSLSVVGVAMLVRRKRNGGVA
ncbi:hypothetical protein F183_A14460 [Bryobacterales bacterium F-183]|nr:hypothetical protein F183_A14460 [Bryobacterales bacterium F-183]